MATSKARMSDKIKAARNPEGIVGNEQWTDEEGVGGPDPSGWTTEEDADGRLISVPVKESTKGSAKRSDDTEPVGPHKAFWQEDEDDDGRPVSVPVE